MYRGFAGFYTLNLNPNKPQTLNPIQEILSGTQRWGSGEEGKEGTLGDDGLLSRALYGLLSGFY